MRIHLPLRDSLVIARGRGRSVRREAAASKGGKTIKESSHTVSFFFSIYTNQSGKSIFLSWCGFSKGLWNKEMKGPPKPLFQGRRIFSLQRNAMVRNEHFPFEPLDWQVSQKRGFSLLWSFESGISL